jgi:folate-binding protein YgfZ
MVSNDVDALRVGDACPALLLTAKARLIAPLVVWRRGDEDFLLLTEPELGETVRTQLTRMRLRARCEIEPEEHESALVFDGEGIATDFPGAVEVLDAGLEPTLTEEELELRRIEAGVPRWGRELTDDVIAEEAGLLGTHVHLDKGCYPGQETVARVHNLGQVQRRLAGLVCEGEAPPPFRADLTTEDGARAGQVRGGAVHPELGPIALAYVRRTIAPGQRLLAGAHAGTVVELPFPRA